MMIRAVCLFRRVLTGTWILVLVGLIGVAAFTRLTTTFVLRGGSMEPAIPVGSLISLETVPASRIRANDVVTLRSDNGVVITHRVVHAVQLPDGLFFEVKGDANTASDPALVPARAVLGRVAMHLPWAGYLAAMLGTASGLISLLALLAAGLVAIWLAEEVEADIEVRLAEEQIRLAKRARGAPGAQRGEKAHDGAIA